MNKELNELFKTLHKYQEIDNILLKHQVLETITDLEKSLKDLKIILKNLL